VAHKILVVIYHMLKNNKPYEELGGDYFDRLEAAQIERRADKPLEQLGYEVTLKAQPLPDKTEQSPPDKAADKAEKSSPNKTIPKPAHKTTKKKELPPEKAANELPGTTADKAEKSSPNKTIPKPAHKTTKKKEKTSLQNV
jgi:hypothetical protein